MPILLHVDNSQPVTIYLDAEIVASPLEVQWSVALSPLRATVADACVSGKATHPSSQSGESSFPLTKLSHPRRDEINSKKVNCAIALFECPLWLQNNPDCLLPLRRL